MNANGCRAEVTGDAGGWQLPSTPAKIVTNEYGFATEGLKPGANRVTFANVGKELHHVIAASMRKGATIEDVKKFTATEGEGSGPPPIDFEASVGTTVLGGGESQVTELKFEQGRYAFLCFIQGRKGGPPHVAKGMLQEIEVE